MAGTPIDRLEHWADSEPERVFLRQPEGGRYRDLTFHEVRDQARRVAGALRKLGLAPGDAVALFSKNCAEWFVADLAIMLGGFVSIPIYPTANTKTVRYILEHSEARAVFVGKLDRPERQEEALGNEILRLGFPYPGPATDHGWAELLESADPLLDAPRPEPGQTMSIVYTSGSTGAPKGVVHTYASLGWAGETVARDLGATLEDRGLSYLPLAHITERAYVEMGSLYAGNSVAFVESLDTFVDDVKRARPTMFISVPRLWALFRERVLATLGERKLDVLLALPRIGDFIRRRVRANLGLEHARLLGCGSAPVDPELLRWYERLDLQVSEGWGMTENAAYGTVQLPFRADKIGSVGRAAIGAEFRVAADGELLFKSPGLMTAYYKQPQETAAALTADGFLRTGDVGYIDTDGYVFITGRVKDIFKTAKGLYVSPLALEQQLQREETIGMACVIGSGLPQPIAVIQLAENARHADREGLRSRLAAYLERFNEELAHHERLDAIVVSDKPWSIENDLLTPTLKVKRHVLERRFMALSVKPRHGEVRWLDEMPPRR